MKTDATPEPKLERLLLSSIKQGINPRTEFDREKLTELAQSLKDDGGPVQPVVVYRDDDGLHGLIAGERRWRAAREAGLETILAIVRQKPLAHLARRLALVENIQRADLTPLEIARAVRDMLAETNEAGVPICSKTQLADELGKKPAFITWCELLLRCSERLQLKVHHGKVPLEVAAMIGSLPPDMHETAETDIVYRPNGCMTREAARGVIAEYRRDLRKGQFNKEDGDLVPGAPPCRQCEFNGARRDDVQGKHKASVCLNPACFDKKQTAYVRLHRAASDDGTGVKMLGQEMRAKVFSFDGVTVKGDSGYVAADERPDAVMLVDPKARVPMWAEIMEGSGVACEKIIDGQGRVRVLFDAKLALEAARAEGSKVSGAFKAATGAEMASARGTKTTDNAGGQKRRERGIIAAAMRWVERLENHHAGEKQNHERRREMVRLVLERLTEPVDRAWMCKVLVVGDVMECEMHETIIGLALVARTMRLQGPLAIGGITGGLCKLIGYDPKREARDIEKLVEAKETGKAKPDKLVPAKAAPAVERFAKANGMTLVKPTKKASNQRGGKRVADPEAEGEAWKVYLKTGSIAKAATACGLDVESVKNWHKRRGWKALREKKVKT